MAVQTAVNILAINPGSSSLKYGLYAFEEPPKTRCHPEPPKDAKRRRTVEGPPAHMPRTIAQDSLEEIAANEMEGAIHDALARVSGTEIHAIGCRVVHGGQEFSGPTLIDDEVLAKIAQLANLAPLHNPIAVTAINALRTALPTVPIVAVFDTAFHQTLPPVAWHYAVPDDLNIRRFGFHGISYAFVSNRLTTHIGQRKRVIICHLGNGASVCALVDGVSIDTSMGLTPMEGLVMGTRSGDIDPGAILYLLRSGRSAAEIDDLLNHKSGLSGLSGGTSDMKKIVEAANAGDPRTALALDVFCYRVSKYIGAYAAALGALDCLTFTAGIGEHSSLVRERICANLRFLGVEIDDSLNRATPSDERLISRGRVPVFVIPTNEELQIARETHRLVIPIR
ncbi:MAG: acetate kinase [Thermoanaerobaculia bacterium]|jgi:acetate kinase|nr:acetate kinase [Thermoanaerobaculia bacterium]